MNATEFVSKWSRVSLSERAASQEHFMNLCAVLGQPTPASHDAQGAEYAFEKRVDVSAPASKGSRGERGFVDVWWKGKFAWEYKRKGKHASLDDAYRQLQQYREDLANPPLLVVCDIARTEIHTNFTGFRSDVHTILLEDLADPANLATLRRVFADPDSFRPSETVEQITEEAARRIGEIAQSLRSRGHDPHDAAHFLMKCMFCLFAEDVELLPKDLFQKILTGSKHDPPRLKKQMDLLFDAMRTGGDFGVDQIAFFNGGLFDASPAIELTEGEIDTLRRASDKHWGSVEPSVFGTLFERSLDPDKRAQIGAHYTSRDDIMLVVEPVIVRPLRREWEQTKADIDAQLERRRKATTDATKRKADQAIADRFDAFQSRLASVRVLDPACGSGNFLYVAIQQLLELEREVIKHAAREEFGVGGLIPRVRPTQLHGIEINTYAAELAQVVIWIGYLQWMRDHGFNAPRDPILEPIRTIEHRDAILAWTDEDGNPIPAWREGAICTGKAQWPEAEFIVGNPPFLGSKLFRKFGLADQYVQAMYNNFEIANTSDLVCYWLDMAREQMVAGLSARAGLIATQAIRGQFSRDALEMVVEQTPLFFAWSDREWVLDGAAVQVSIVGFAVESDGAVSLDGVDVESINANLTTGPDLTTACRLQSNQAIAFMGNTKGGDFDLEWSEAREMLAEPNPVGSSNFDVIRPWQNGLDLTRRPRSKWLIDFGVERSIDNVAVYAAPFAHLLEHVKPEREGNRRASYAEYWWIHAEPRSNLRNAVGGRRFIATPNLTKYRFFVMMAETTIPDHQLIAFARSDNYFLGVLHSSVHELWARRQGTQLREAESGFRYTPTTCFETFPLPWPPGAEPEAGAPGRAAHDAIAAAAEALDTQRERWLNPPEYVEEIAARVDAQDTFDDVARVSGEEARRLIRQSAIDAASAKHPELKKRTLTNLYNQRPTWLRLAHRALDEAVLGAYALVDPEGGWDRSWAAVFEETGAGQPLPEGHALRARREEVEQAILGALLRLNHERAGVDTTS
ncbi:MAG: class I SAM-dependent DNA methyltransferase [Phycisphaerales bacterium]